MAFPATNPLKGIYEALIAVQREADALQKNAINPHFKSKYLSLDVLMYDILPLLNKHDILLTQTPTFVGGIENDDGSFSIELQPALQTVLYHVPSDESIESTMLLMVDKETPQGQGSSITYARRYSLVSILGLIVDQDDDGNAARGKTRKATTNVRSAERDANFDLGSGDGYF